jgi:hypothetical protein
MCVVVQGGGVMNVACVCLMSARAAVLRLCFACDPLLSLMRATAHDWVNVVDLYNSATGAWSTAQLSVARERIAATSVGNMALFAGGSGKGVLLYKGGRGGGVMIFACVCFQCLRVLLYTGCVFSCDRLLSLMRATADYYSNVVDLYNLATGAWSTAQLSVARLELAATSVGNVALFAGGSGKGALLYKGADVMIFACVCLMSARAAVFRLCFSCPLALSHPRHRYLLFQCC